MEIDKLEKINISRISGGQRVDKVQSPEDLLLSNISEDELISLEEEGTDFLRGGVQQTSPEDIPYATFSSIKNLVENAHEGFLQSNQINTPYFKRDIKAGDSTDNLMHFSKMNIYEEEFTPYISFENPGFSELELELMNISQKVAQKQQEEILMTDEENENEEETNPNTIFVSKAKTKDEKKDE